MSDLPGTPFIQHGVPTVVLAPMEGVTDVTMRALLSELGGFNYCVAEFLRISNSVPGPKVFRRHVPELIHNGRTASGLPVQVQLLGGDPDTLAQAAQIAVAAGARGVDLNFGCPARTVNRHDGGATLLKHPERIREIVRTVRAAVSSNIPVSAKLRLGWDDIRAIHVNADRAAEGGASWLTIHARTKCQGYRPPAYWKPIGEVRARLNLPIVANGEVWSIDDLRRCRDETGCIHFMLGRGALADPSLARAAARELGIAAAWWPQCWMWTKPDWLRLISRFVKISAAWGLPQRFVASRIKQWLNIVKRHGTLDWFDAAKVHHDLTELLDHLGALAACTSP